jgi:hypothetical protein
MDHHRISCIFVELDVSVTRISATQREPDEPTCWNQSPYKHALYHITFSRQAVELLGSTACVERHIISSFQAQKQVTTLTQISTSFPVPIDILLRILPLPLGDQRLAVILTVRQPVDRVDMTFRRGGVGQEDYPRR